MKYQTRRRLYSQNFLVNRELILKLIRKSSIGKNDTVIEIGSGSGMITQELLHISGRVIAVERDWNLYYYLLKKFRHAKNLKLYRANFLDFNLPKHPYNVFANIPFAITSDIMRKLTSDDSFKEGYLIMQKEAAEKFIGIPYAEKNTMMAILLKPFFEIGVVWRFNRSDFIPGPSVDIIMVKIKRVENSVIETKDSELYRDFVVYNYSRKKVGYWTFEDWIRRFNYFVDNVDANHKHIISVKAKRFLEVQSKIVKIRRSRVDKNWRKFI
ncbi:hypothetical protein A2961_01790 [Candidatus Woesebacteria bacterium RIFCSPLOWO2_01_FULL_39_21]|uniref:Ribosomal RNA adenine methylase transferase N-terminal domain-containing protein n=1 Tax=Candidatus Woesebacteria bacterium RIFCSPLOWO2_01_FULL_39_21 TaxID=1802519 RepID=A0A1F8BB73_9BACT|nr:MAG: hypothetical protein A2691_01395 [Candidatus Woesebacteria bacterium RIFCSPHIGHO2_01_FULL_39_23]OGM61281.1 MAG: hypothetical protein A2961_01790 [Candidatus Woesebacteria bacterium RIFCSPLOWO2_01_FULL_39_21]